MRLADRYSKLIGGAVHGDSGVWTTLSTIYLASHSRVHNLASIPSGYSSSSTQICSMEGLPDPRRTSCVEACVAP